MPWRIQTLKHESSEPVQGKGISLPSDAKLQELVDEPLENWVKIMELIVLDIKCKSQPTHQKQIDNKLQWTPIFFWKPIVFYYGNIGSDFQAREYKIE